MIKHIGTSAIMDLLLRMLTCIEPQQLRQDVLNVRMQVIYIYIHSNIYTYLERRRCRTDQLHHVGNVLFNCDRNTVLY